MKLRHILMAFAAGAALLASCDELQEFIDDHQDEINDVINSEGDGSLESPYNAVAAVAEAKKLGWNSSTDYEMAGPYYIKGVVSEIKKEYQANYGTAIFSIADKEDSKTSFLAYGLLYLDNKKWQEGQTQIKVGDEVILYGQIMNYKGETPETVQNQAYLYSLNGVTENTAPDNPNTGDETDYENAPEISISEFLSLADSATVYKLTGIVKGNINTTYGNFNLYEEDSDVHVYIYGVAEWDQWKDKVAEGCKVTLAGKYFPYQNASGSIVQEIKDAHILAVEEGAGPEPVETEGDGTLESPYTVNDITSLILSGNTPSEDVFIEGTISAIRFTFDANYGTATFWISADGVAHGVSEDLKSTTDPENDFLCYSVYTLGGEAWVDGNTQIAVGDDVIICGKVTNYNGLPETSSKNAYIYSLNGVTENGDPQPQQEALEVTVAEFLAAETSETQAYQLTGKIANLASTVYGNFDLVDETGSVYVYGLTASELGYGAKNDQSFATLGLAEGDTIVIIGYRYIYTNNNTGESKDEVAYAWFVEKLASGDPVQVKDPVEVTVAEFLAAPESKDQPYKLTGTVEKLENTTYGNFDLVDETGSVYVYGLTATDLGYGGSNDKSFESLGIEEGDKIIIIGYRGVYNDTDEVKFAYLVENLGQDKPQQELYGDGTLENPYLPSDAIAVASALEVGEKTEDDVYVIGYIATIKYTFSEQYGTATFTINDGADGAPEFQCYGVYYLENKPWVEGFTQIYEGDQVIIRGKLTNWNGTPETASKEAYIYELNGNTKAEEIEPITVELEGDGTLDNPYTVNDAITIATDLENGEKTEEVFVQGKIASIKYTFNQQYGTATFNISEDGEVEEDHMFQCYSVYYLENNPWVEGFTQIEVGDDVIIYGKITNYNGIPETASKEAYIYSLNGQTEAEEIEIVDPGTVDAGEYDNTVSITTNNDNASYYDGVATVNGVEGVKVLKLGTAKKYGVATITLPAGSTSLSFYGVAWKGNPASVKISSSAYVFEFDLAANAGATNNSPFTITCSEADKFQVSFDALAQDTEFVVETYSGANTGCRAILFGIQAYGE